MGYHRDKCEVTFNTPTGKQTQIFRDYKSLADWAHARAQEQAERHPQPLIIHAPYQASFDLTS
jgi:hypothetical protein